VISFTLGRNGAAVGFYKLSSIIVCFLSLRRRVRLKLFLAMPLRRYVMAFSFFILIEQQTI
jgi:hypothetical protein